LEDTVKKELAKTYPTLPLTFAHNPTTPSPSSGTGILLYAQTTLGHRIASSAMLEIPTREKPGTLAKQEVKARDRGMEVVRRLIRQLAYGGVVDEYLADQIVIFMALATSGTNPPIAIDRGSVGTTDGKKRRCEVLVGEVSLHTETAMRIAETMLGNILFSTQKMEDGGIVIVCERKSVDMVHE
jgi:RNA 3'-terminal phosphate cyclase (ATP)